MSIASLTARIYELPHRLRAAIGCGLIALVLLGVTGGLLAHPQRIALFAGSLHPEQVSEVEERLASWNVPFTPSADNVTVDAKHRSDLLLRLSIAGVPHAHIDGSGDVLDKLGALTPQAVIDAQTRDGLAGDIELALRGIEGIQDARVIVAPAKQGYFVDDTSRNASASVRVRLIPGARLAPETVSGIRAFVAAAVAGLDARNVTIVDDRGVELGDGGNQDDSQDIQRSLQSALDQAVGSGATIVRVHVERDPREMSSRDVRRTPLSSLPITANTQDERYAGQDRRYDRTQQQLDRGSETREVATSAQAGRTDRISAAVFVDAQRVADLTQIRSLAAATLGIDQRRGDTLEVQAISFTRAPASKKDAWWLAYGALVPLLPTLVAAVAVLIALQWARPPITLLAKACCERLAVSRTTQAVKGAAPASVRGALLHEPPHTAAAIISALPAATAAAVLDMYPEHERAAIVRRMQRPHSPLVSDPENLIAQA